MLSVGAIGVVVSMLSAALLVAGLVRDVHRARGAADLAALAVAGPMAAGEPADCGAADQVARANGALLTACDLQHDGAVVVSVSIPRSSSARWLPGPSAVTARARAGVVEDGG